LLGIRRVPHTYCISSSIFRRTSILQSMAVSAAGNAASSAAATAAAVGSATAAAAAVAAGTAGIGLSISVTAAIVSLKRKKDNVVRLYTTFHDILFVLLLVAFFSLYSRRLQWLSLAQ
jgi:nitrate reductase gamma subunit